jgi:hypothetical protein
MGLASGKFSFPIGRFLDAQLFSLWRKLRLYKQGMRELPKTSLDPMRLIVEKRTPSNFVGLELAFQRV